MRNNHEAAVLFAKIAAATQTLPAADRAAIERRHQRLEAWRRENPVAYMAGLGAIPVLRAIGARTTGARSLCFLVGLADALEYRLGDAVPSRLWHFCDDRKRWVSIPAPAVDRLLPYFEALEDWISPDNLADRVHEGTTTAEALLADQSGLHVVPAEQLPTLTQIGLPLVEALLEAERQRAEAADASPTPDE